MRRSARLLFVIATCLVEPSAMAAGSQIQMQRIATVPTVASTVISTPLGLDFDHDGRREFVIRKMGEGTSFGGRMEFYEQEEGGGFALVHVLELANNPNDSFYPGDVGDADQDGLTELVVFGKDWTGPGTNEWPIRVYESPAPDEYPSELIWQVDNGGGWSVGVLIADTDADGEREIVVGGRVAGETSALDERVAVYECSGDNSYEQAYYQLVFDKATSQSFDVSSDLDGDGRVELLYGAFYASPEETEGKIVVIENTGDDQYDTVWEGNVIYTDGQPVNVGIMVDAGDLDGDGRKEFLAGGRKTVASLVQPFIAVLYVYEAVADDTYEAVTSFWRPLSSSSYSSATLADVNGDGRKEIVFGANTSLSVYENVGDNLWQRVWDVAACPTTLDGCMKDRTIGAGDFDGDGMEELVFPEDDFTGIWEIDPRYAADLDSDGTVDAIDNCPSAANPGQEDADADAVGDACDNCADASNPEQGPAVLGQTILAPSPDEFAWQTPVDVDWVRGDLALVGGYATDLFESLDAAVGLTDTTAPESGAGFWYLVKPSCLVGSWQSEIGAEPGRDEALP